MSWHRLTRFGGRRFVPAMATILGITTACSDRGPTSPIAEGIGDPGSLSFNRETPTFGFATIDVPGALSTSPQGINAGGDISDFTSTQANTLTASFCMMAH